jgi:hypothetical protein
MFAKPMGTRSPKSRRTTREFAGFARITYYGFFGMTLPFPTLISVCRASRWQLSEAVFNPDHPPQHHMHREI